MIGDYVIVYCTNSKKEIIETKFSLCDLDRLKQLKGKITARYNWSNDSHYASINVRFKNDLGEDKHTLLRLHRWLLGLDTFDRNIIVDHINHDTLDNRRDNLRIVEARKNSSNRGGANKNSKTGTRNVSFINRKYLVQIMKDGIRYKWEFPPDQFEEACKFADIKRKEIFGEYAGVG